MEEEPLPSEQASKEAEAPISLEEIEKIFADLVEQMSATSKKMALLGKRIREESFSTEDLERQYLSLPVDQRPSWFEYVAEHATTKKFAPKKANTGIHTQYGHTQ